MELKYKCEICNREFVSAQSIVNHIIGKHHLTSKEYFDKYMKNPGEGICPLCGVETSYRNMTLRYRKYCDKCGSSAENTERLEHIHSTRRNNHDGLWNSNFVKDRMKAICKILYGVEYYFQTVDLIQRNREICEKRTKEDWDKINSKIADTLYKKYGEKVTNCSQLSFVKQKKRNKRKTQKTFCAKYKFNNLFFDSSFELYYYIWLKDHNIDFEYQPDSIEFIFEGESHDYCPDFKVGNEIHEIKGLQFFENNNPNGKMINPYNKHDNGYAEAKHQCMIEHNVKIITDITEYKNYVDSKYGKKFIKSCKVR